ncbi:unnamed protein product [Symbiodinium necroappetens]|uniref:Calmodulin n=1 Tax=Symbiodinium necroappetens TaxID=1628268 RepID=A0A812X1A0_9DINO|nr:unnamed protein product [Symbiodinium necroappetens]
MPPKKPAAPPPPKPGKPKSAGGKATSDAKIKAEADALNSGTAALTQQQLEALRKKYDTDKDSSLAYAEFSGLCKELAALQKAPTPREEDLKAIFEEFDKDDSNKLSMQEFNWAYATLQRKVQEAAATKIQARVRGNQARSQVEEGSALKGRPKAPPPPPPPKKAGAKAKAQTAGTAALSEEQMNQLRQKYDTNNDKMLTVEEFDAMAREIATLKGQKLPPDMSLKEVFLEFDKDGSGKMSMEEFNWAYATLQQEVEAAAAVKIQAKFRGNQARSEVDDMKKLKAGHPPPPKGVAAVKSKAQSAASSSGTAGLTQAQMVAPREKFDVDGDQTMTLAEFKGLARQISQMQGHAAPSYDVLEEIFDEFDKDFTGKMGMDEFNWAYATLQLKVKEEAVKEASRVLKIRLDRSGGEKLGLALDTKTLEIRGINPDSLAARWNYANPRTALQVGYKIKKVNAKTGMAGYSEELMNAAVKVLDIEAVPGSRVHKPPKFYHVRLDRSSGGKLGMQVEQPSLEIQNLAAGGLACQWNEMNPKERIRPGDSIVKVNGKNGLTGFKEDMMNPKVEVLEIQLAPLSRYHEDDEEVPTESSVLTEEEEAVERYKVIIEAMQELSEAEKKRRANAEKRRLKAIRDGKEALAALEATQGDFYRQMAQATLPEDLTVQAEDQRRERLAREAARRQQERTYDHESLVVKQPALTGNDSSDATGRSTFACPCCGRLFYVFMEAGQHYAVVAHGVELLGQDLPLSPPQGPPVAKAAARNAPQAVAASAAPSPSQGPPRTEPPSESRAAPPATGGGFF